MLSSFFSGISGLMANSQSINVVGNNIANVNTVGYKASRATFEDVLYQSILGSSGTSQVGRGTSLSSVDTIFSQGSFESTSEGTDLAIGGKGFFIVQAKGGESSYYTRAGQFRFDKEGYLTNPEGYILQGKEIDRATHAPTGVDTDVIIQQTPSEPRATELIGMCVNLQSNTEWKGNIATSLGAGTGGTAISSVPTLTDGSYVRAGTHTLTLTSDGAATPTYTLTDSVALVNPDGTSGGTKTYSATVEAGKTYTNFGDDGAGNGSGLTMTMANAFTAADLGKTQTLQVDGFSTNDTSTTRNPTATSDYSSSITAYDSLGQPHTVTVYFRKAYDTAATAAAGATSTWEWMAHLDSADSATGLNALESWGTMSFNSNGILMSGSAPTTVNFNFAGGGTQSQNIDISFAGAAAGGNDSTQFPISSTTNFQTQDGYPPGVLQSVTVDTSGVISGHYSNGQILDLYQLTLANFNNPWGLTREGGNLYGETLNSGVAQTSAPGEAGLGKINPNSLEQSNVDLATEFVKMIIAQRGFQANSRVITTTDEILQELMNLKR
jgi:flagellar hook protein FlgE